MQRRLERSSPKEKGLRGPRPRPGDRVAPQLRGGRPANQGGVEEALGGQNGSGRRPRFPAEDLLRTQGLGSPRT